MIELSKALMEFIKTIPQGILSELWSIGQEHIYINSEWRHIDEFWRQLSYAHREGNNPE